MKFYPLIFLSLLIFSACSQDDSIIDQEEEEEQEEEIVYDYPLGWLSVYMDSQLFVATTVTAVKSEITVANPNTGIDFQSEQLDIFAEIPSTTLMRNINIKLACTEFGFDLSIDDTPTDCGLFFSYSEFGLENPIEPIIVLGETGEVVIESYDGNYIKGTFSYSGFDETGEEYSITEGIFEVPVTQ